MTRTLLLGTRKGTVILDHTSSGWRPRTIEHAGIPVCYATRDPRTGTLWSCLDHGHWGPKLSRSEDDGKSWQDITSLKYPEGARYITKFLPTGDEDEQPKANNYSNAAVYKIWHLAFGHTSQPGRIYAGTIPGGLFVSDNNGDSWTLNRPLWNHPSRGGDLFAGDASSENTWAGTPASIDYGIFEPGIHSIVVNPTNPDHLYVAISTAGVMESTDGGNSWRSRNRGLRMEYMPDPEAEWGHDPHFMTACPGAPEYLWQQNHCGVFFSRDGGEQWHKVSQSDNGVHFGFPIAVHETDGNTAWVVPARSDDLRMALVDGLCVARTSDGGKTWTRFTHGLPQTNAYDIVLRHALDISGNTLAFGSSTGNLYLSDDGGEHWQCLGNNFPPIYSVRFG